MIFIIKKQRHVIHRSNKIESKAKETGTLDAHAKKSGQAPVMGKTLSESHQTS